MAPDLSCTPPRRSRLDTAFVRTLTLAWLPLLSTLYGCATASSPPFRAERELYPAVLDNDRPLYVLRSDVDQYTCARGVRMVCDGATMSHLMCRCPSIPPPP